MPEYMYTAAIIEPRLHPAFELVLENFFTHLDDRWGFIIFHGNPNKEYIHNLIENRFNEYKHRVKYVHLNINNLTLLEYSMLLRNRRFYEYIDTEMFLIFQLDTLISDVYYNNIYDFMQYDYVGAPWPAEYDNGVGNGGLSLRRKSKMLEIIDNHDLPNWHHEDGYFCSYENMYKPMWEEAKRFSVETVYHDASFGIHKAWHHLSMGELIEISKHIPAIYTLQYMLQNYKGHNSNEAVANIDDIFPGT